MEPEPPNSDEGSSRFSLLQSAVAIVVLLAVVLYAVGIVAGVIPNQHKLAGADVAVLVVGALVSVGLLRPQLLNRLTHFKLGSLEFELQQLQKNQKAQQDELDDVRFVLTLLLQDSERKHLLNLRSGATPEYVGGHPLRSELRRLRTLGLISSLPGRKIGDLADGKKLDLKTFVQLTDRGNQYLDKLGDFEL